MVTIDGSYGEGGGQILRTSLALAAILGEELRIENIRANRSKPGLRPQHLTGALALRDITGGRLDGAEVGSQTLTFRPGKARPGPYLFDIAATAPSAGSVTLLSQTLLPVAVIASGNWEFALRGGTHVPWSPPFEYIEHVFLPTVREMGVNAEVSLEQAGYYPVGGGGIRLRVRPSDGLRGIKRTGPQRIDRVKVCCLLSSLPEHIAQRCIRSAIGCLPDALAQGTTQQVLQPASRSPGTATTVLLDGPSGPAGFGAVGERRKKSEAVGREAGQDAARFLKAGKPVDRRLADQLLLYMALARMGSAECHSEIETEEITLHTTTNVHVIESFADVRFAVHGTTIRCG